MKGRWNEIIFYFVSTGRVVTWLGKEAKIAGEAIDGFGKFDEGFAGQPVTGKLGPFAFEVISYNKETDVFHIKRLN